MKKIVVSLVFCLCLCEAQVVENDGKVDSCSGLLTCCGSLSLLQKFGAFGEKLTNMAEKIAVLEDKLQNTEKTVLELQSIIGGAPQVAFSATLRDSGSGNTGPFTTDTPLPYKKVFSNAGNCYNPSTGIFTAMVKGMYFFRFSMFNNLNPVANSVVSLRKNSVRLTSVWDTSGSDSNDMGSNAVVIPLEVGDNVYVELQANRLVFDDGMGYNTFSGFLLFTM